MAKFLHLITEAKPYTGQEVLYLHHKLDGHRITACKQPPFSDNRALILYTRSQSDLFPELFSKAVKCKIWPWLEKLMSIPAYSSIDGELYVPGKPASYVKTAIKECDPELRFTAFAFPWLERQRRYTDSLEWAMEQCSLYQVPFAPFLKLDKPTSIDPDYWRNKIHRSTEGWVAKKHHYVGWYKIKRVKTIDLIVTGFKEGKGKYEGLTGALICSCYGPNGDLIEVCLCSGMTDEERKQITKNDIGRTCEVSFQEVASLGRLRHPNFVRWRDDEKKPFECTMAQEPELLTYWSNRASG